MLRGPCFTLSPDDSEYAYNKTAVLRDSLTDAVEAVNDVHIPTINATFGDINVDTDLSMACISMQARTFLPRCSPLRALARMRKDADFQDDDSLVPSSAYVAVCLCAGPDEPHPL